MLKPSMLNVFLKIVAIRIPILASLSIGTAFAKGDQYQEISLSNRYELRSSLANSFEFVSSFKNSTDAIYWIAKQSKNIENRVPNREFRHKLLRTIHYEATRFNLNPDMVLALIEVESGFNRFALSPVGASGLMQVMPFWRDLIGDPRDSLFDMHTNLRYGCIILRHYLDIENDNLERAMARYNGSLGATTYPDAVLAIWRNKYRSY